METTTEKGGKVETTAGTTFGTTIEKGVETRVENKS